MVQRQVPLLAALLPLLVSCTSTRLAITWRDPSVSVTEGSLNKVLFIALLRDESTRRAAEDRLVSLSRAEGVASYAYLGGELSKMNDPGMNDQLIKDGIDGVVIMRLVDQTQEQTYVPGTTMPGYYGSPYGYYGYAAPMYYDPGYVRTDVTYTVETNVYSTKLGRLVWTGTTSTVNPSSLERTVSEIVDVIHYRMAREGFLKPAPRK